MASNPFRGTPRTGCWGVVGTAPSTPTPSLTNQELVYRKPIGGVSESPDRCIPNPSSPGACCPFTLQETPTQHPDIRRVTHCAEKRL